MKLQHLIATGLGYRCGGGRLMRLLPSPPLVTTGIASLRPVSEAVLQQAPSSPSAGPKAAPLQRRRLVELANAKDRWSSPARSSAARTTAEERSALDQMEINRGAARTRSGARREGSRQERRRANRIRAALDASRGSQRSGHRGAEGAARPAAAESPLSPAWSRPRATARSARSAVPP